MHVIGHQAPGPHRGRTLPAGVAQQGQIERVVRIAEEGPMPVVAALGDVVRNAREDQARGSRHDSRLNGNRGLNQPFPLKARTGWQQGGRDSLVTVS